MYVQERPGGPGTQVLTMRRFLIFVASLAFLPAMVYAQGRGMGRGMASGMARPAMARPAMARPVMAAPHFAMRSAQPVGSHGPYGTRAFPGVRYIHTRSGALVAHPPLRQTNLVRSTRSNRAVLSEDVPGLGFDYAHFAATHPRGTHGRGHGRDRNDRFVGAYFPFYGGGYYMPLFPDDEDVAEAPAADAQQADAAGAEAEQSADIERPVTPSQDYVQAPHPLPPQDSDEYVFVRRDGTLFFATAFAWENGTLRYITREGLRHTLALDKLDLNATQQFNEQRGLNFRLPV
ncbi:MAG: hypothetical protein WA789_10235 [Candidatus Acidiferrum sp.]